MSKTATRDAILGALMGGESMFMAGIMMPRLRVSIRGSKLAMMVLEASTDFP